MTLPQHTLTVEHGCLCLARRPGDEHARILLYVYPAGDCDSVPWPKEPLREDTTRTWEERLAGTIFDAVETGDIPEHHGQFTVVLPDGTPFDYLAHVR